MSAPKASPIEEEEVLPHHRGQSQAEGHHRGSVVDGDAPHHGLQPPPSLPIQFPQEMTGTDGGDGGQLHHHHTSHHNLNSNRESYSSESEGDYLDCRPPSSQSEHHNLPQSTSTTSPSHITIESTSSPDNEAPLSMSDSSSQPSVTPPPPQPPTTKPKLARVSSDPGGRSSFPASTPPLLPSGNRPAGVPLPSHMHRAPTMDNSHHQPPAGPSTSTARSTRYADPDSHWLSEDEGESFIDDLQHRRQSPRRRGGPRLRSSYPISTFDHHNDDDDHNPDGKNSLSLDSGGDGKGRSRTTSTTSQQEELFIDSAPPHSISAPVQPLQPATSNIHHTDAPRSSIAMEHRTVRQDSEPNAAFKDYAPFIKDLSAITPSLLKALTCPSCRKVMTDPTTLACGHSECLLCVAPKAASVLLRRTSPTSPPIAITAAVLTTEEGSRFNDNSQSLPSPSLDTANYTELSSSTSNPRAILADGVCPIPTCKKVTKATTNGRQGLRVDVVLQKLAFLLKSRVALEGEEDDDEDSDILAPTPRRRSPPRGTLLDVDPEEEGSLSEPILRAGSHSPALSSRSRAYRRTSPPASSIGYLDITASERERSTSNTSSPDEETKSEDNSKRSMKSKAFNNHHRKTQKKLQQRSSGSGMMSKRQQAGLPALVTDILSELECHICVTLIYDPITTMCGHTFCKKCLLRSLDHSNRCPLCRSELPGMSYFIHAPINFTLSNLVVTTFPMLHEQRRDLLKQEENESGLDTPIFVCMVSFPFMPTNLHIYEPRYRLMMRRALDTNKKFGMVLPSRNAGSGGFSQYGTMLEIKNMHVFDDGRSMIETVGVSRFKVLESGTLDGYTVGKIERIDDIGDDEELELERSALARSSARMAEENRNARHDAASSSSSPAIGTIDEKVASSTSDSAGRHTHSQQSTSPPASRPATGLRALSFTRHRSSSITSSSSNHNNRRNSTSPPTQVSDPATSSTNPNDASASDSVELTNEELVNVCKGFVEALRTGSTPWLLQRLNSSLPPMPDDPREFTWWMAMLMPIDDHEKARLLQITSYRLRLRLLVFWIQQMQHSWWFSRGCTVS